jgi:hypothetical protein
MHRLIPVRGPFFFRLDNLREGVFRQAALFAWHFLGGYYGYLKKIFGNNPLDFRETAVPHASRMGAVRVVPQQSVDIKRKNFGSQHPRVLPPQGLAKGMRHLLENGLCILF